MRHTRITIPSPLLRDVHKEARKFKLTAACLIRVVLTIAIERPALVQLDWGSKSEVRLSLPARLDQEVEEASIKQRHLYDDYVAGLIFVGIRRLRRDPRRYLTLVTAEREAYQERRAALSEQRDRLVTERMWDFNKGYGL